MFCSLFCLLFKAQDSVPGISQLVEPSLVCHRLTKFLLIPGIISSGTFQGRESPSECRAALPRVGLSRDGMSTVLVDAGGNMGLLGSLSHLQHPGGPICCG